MKRNSIFNNVEGWKFYNFITNFLRSDLLKILIRYLVISTFFQKRTYLFHGTLSMATLEIGTKTHDKYCPKELSNTKVKYQYFHYVFVPLYFAVGNL